jgi:predicted TIM-barrel fold metal-dependent hydrolase
MKVSGIYRLGGTPEQNMDFAREAMPLLVQAFGVRRLVWGSDWPHTQFEAQMNYAGAVEQLRQLECTAQVRRALLIEAPQGLFGF